MRSSPSFGSRRIIAEEGGSGGLARSASNTPEMAVPFASSKTSGERRPTPGRPKRLARTAVRLAATLLVLVGFPLPEAGAGGASNGRIAYASRKHIFTMTSEGSYVRRITHTKTHNRTPAWSPDGRLLAYGCLGDRSSERDICTSRADGSRRRNITSDMTPDRDPDWAPGGRRIVFSRKVGAIHQLFVMRRNGDELRQITNIATDARDPEWSPDGKSIIFIAVGPLGGPDIFSVRPSGEGLHNLTMTREYEGAPSWSPDGMTILFARDGEIMTMAADGTRIRPLGIRGHNPKWAPDGHSLVAHRLRESSYQRCFSTRLDGSGVRWLSPRTKHCYSPDWAPRL